MKIILLYEYIRNIKFGEIANSYSFSEELNNVSNHKYFYPILSIIVRIISGKHKGKRIITPNNLPVSLQLTELKKDYLTY